MKRSISALTLLMAATASWGAPATALPWHDDFTSHDNVWLIDSNNDQLGFGLNYDPALGVFDSFVYDGREAFKDADDWLIFPVFHFQEGLTYTITMRTNCSGSGSADFECFLGQGDEDMDDLEVRSWTMQGEPWVIVPAADTWEEHSFFMTSTLSGDYRFALHFTSSARQKYRIDWITIGEGLKDSSPEQASATRPSYKIEDRRLKVSFDITLPTTDVSGNVLEAQLTPRIERVGPDGQSKEFVLDATGPGETVTFIDSDGIGGSSEYNVRAFNADAPGRKTVVQSTPTYSTPKSPTNVVLARTSGNHFKLSWDAVTAGTSSYSLFNPATVTYDVQLADGTAPQLSYTGATEVEFDYPLPESGQIGAFVSVCAVNERGTSSAAKSNAIVIGHPLDGPFHESFSGAKYEKQVWSAEPVTGAWAVGSPTSSVPAHDNDKGLVKYGQSSGKTGELVSPILDLSGMTRPYLRFHIFNNPSSTLKATVVPVVRVYETGEEFALCEPVGDHDRSLQGWTERLVPVTVPAEKLAECQLVFRGTGDVSYKYIYLDDISICDLPHDVDLSVESVLLPDKTAVGKPSPVKIIIVNNGTTDIDEFSVGVTVDGRDAEVLSGSGLEHLDRSEMTFLYTPVPEHSGKDVEIELSVLAPGDQNPDNDRMAVEIRVTPSLLPKVEDLSAGIDGGAISLTWSRPLPGESSAAEVTEDFEKWAAGALMGEMNRWTFLDIDGLPTKGYGADDPAYKTLIGAEIYTVGGADGSCGLIVPNCYGEGGLLYGHPEKWIILPEIIPATEVILHRGAKNCYGKSTAVDIEYCYSPTDATPGSFLVMETEQLLKSDWAEKTFVLPTDARYFAIHVKDCQAKYFSIDDVTYTTVMPAPTLQAINVYTDGALRESLPADAESYAYTLDDAVETSAPALNSEPHTAYVSALYDMGESAASNTINLSELASVGVTEAPAIPVSVKGRDIDVLYGSVKVYDVAGRLVTVLSAGSHSLPCAGIYILRTETATLKVYMR